jgi:hypothetical protein
MGNTALGINNLVKTGALTAGSSAVNMPVANLQLDAGAPSQAWQTVSGVLTAGAGATFRITPPARQLWRLFGLFRTNLSQGANVSFSVYANPSTLIWTGSATGPSPGYGQSVVAAPSDQPGDYCVVNINDPSNPDGFVNVPLAYAGPAWIPAYGQTWQSTFGRDNVVDEMTSRGGQEYPTYRYQQRRWEVALDAIVDAELWSSAEELDRLSRYGGNILYVPDFGSPTMGNEAVFGRLTVTADVSFTAGVAGIRAWRFRCKERL